MACIHQENLRLVHSKIFVRPLTGLSLQRCLQHVAERTCHLRARRASPYNDDV